MLRHAKKSRTMTLWSQRVRLALVVSGIVLCICSFTAAALGMIGAAILWTPTGAVLLSGGFIVWRHMPMFSMTDKQMPMVYTSRFITTVSLATLLMVISGLALTQMIAIRFPMVLFVCLATIVWAFALAGISESLSVQIVRLVLVIVFSLVALVLVCTANELQLSLPWRDIGVDSAAFAGLPLVCVVPRNGGVFTPHGDLSHIANATIQDDSTVGLVWSSLNCIGKPRMWVRVELTCDHALFGSVHTAWLNLCDKEQVTSFNTALPFGASPDWLTGLCGTATICITLRLLTGARRALITFLNRKAKQDSLHLHHSHSMSIVSAMN
jgi:hypothetical protein